MQQTKVGHRHGSHLGLARSLPEQGGGKRASLGCGRTTLSLLAPTSVWQLHGGMLRTAWVVSYFISYQTDLKHV